MLFHCCQLLSLNWIDWQFCLRGSGLHSNEPGKPAPSTRLPLCGHWVGLGGCVVTRDSAVISSDWSWTERGSSCAPRAPPVGQDFCWLLCTSQWIQHSGHFSLLIQEVGSWALRVFLLRWYKQIIEEVKSNFPLLLLFSQPAIQKTEPTFFFGWLLKIALNWKGRNSLKKKNTRYSAYCFQKRNALEGLGFLFFFNKAVCETFQTKCFPWHCSYLMVVLSFKLQPKEH